MASLLDSSSESDEEVVLKPLSKREVQLSTGNSQPRMELRLNYPIPYFLLYPESVSYTHLTLPTKA